MNNVTFASIRQAGGVNRIRNVLGITYRTTNEKTICPCYERIASVRHATWCINERLGRSSYVTLQLCKEWR